MQDAGVRSVWARAPAGAVLPEGIAGVYWSEELATAWTVSVADGVGSVRARGPVASGPAWPMEAVAPGVVRVHVPGTLYRAWLDVRIVESGLEVNGGRAKRVAFVRVAG